MQELTWQELDTIADALAAKTRKLVPGCEAHTRYSQVERKVIEMRDEKICDAVTAELAADGT